MIALPSRMPLLRAGRFHIPGGENSAEWIEKNLREAAQAAGREDWWFAADVVRSLMIYLRDRFPGSVITVEELAEKIRSTLEVIGFGEIGRRLHLRPARVTLSLADLAREAGDGFELKFFQLLEARLEEIDRLGAGEVSLTETRLGVKHLRAAKYWCRSCRELEREIAGYLRRRSAEGKGCRVELCAD